MEHDRGGINIFTYFTYISYIYNDFVFQGNAHLSCFDQLKFLILDEADRMVERGHFAELKDILHKINGQPLCDDGRRQKLVFSATLTLPKKKKKKGKKPDGQTGGIGIQLFYCITGFVCKIKDWGV